MSLNPSTRVGCNSVFNTFKGYFEGFKPHRMDCCLSGTELVRDHQPIGFDHDF